MKESEFWSKTSKSWEGIFDLSGVQDKIAQLEVQSAEETFWNDSDTAQKLLRELSRLKASIEPVLRLRGLVESLGELAEMVEDETSSDADEVRAELAEVETAYEQLQLDMLLSAEDDAANAIVEINAGAGGTEACDWVSMLMRMYLRWAERRGFQAEVVNSVEGDVAGLKNVTVIFRGRNAYGYLKNERGVHRLVRISPFDANKRRHTTFAAVDVIPELEEDQQVQISPDDIRVETFRASGAGGQHVNKTDSAVRITHLATGIVVSCQNERSQHKNRESAMKVLASKLAEVQSAETEQRISQLRGDIRAIEWGSQMRSYVFQPYTMVKDHRTNHETGDVVRVMDGDMDDFIQSALRQGTSTGV